MTLISIFTRMTPMFRAYLLIGLMITYYSLTQKRESCHGVDHSIPSVIIDPNTKCEGSMYIGAGLARWRRAQLWDRDTAGRCRCSHPGKHSHLSRNLQPICAHRFFCICVFGFVDFPRRKTCFQFAQAVNGEEGGVVNIVSQVGQSVSQSVGVSSNTDAWVWVWWTEENGVRIDHNLSLPVLAVGQCL